jgi:hypothetical protein
VGILIATNTNYSIIKEFKEDCENILGLVININGVKIALVSVYGPNHNDRNFFSNISVNLLPKILVCPLYWVVTGILLTPH